MLPAHAKNKQQSPVGRFNLWSKSKCSSGMSQSLSVHKRKCFTVGNKRVLGCTTPLLGREAQCLQSAQSLSERLGPCLSRPSGSPSPLPHFVGHHSISSPFNESSPGLTTALSSAPFKKKKRQAGTSNPSKHQERTKGTEHREYMEYKHTGLQSTGLESCLAGLILGHWQLLFYLWNPSRREAVPSSPSVQLLVSSAWQWRCPSHPLVQECSRPN